MKNEIATSTERIYPILVPPTKEEQDELIKIRKNQIQFLQRLLKEVLEEGIDYGSERGIKEPFLRKAGAIQTCLTFNMTFEFVELDKIIDLDRDFPFIYYEYKTNILNPSGKKIGEGRGCCSNYESKYRYEYGDEIKDPLNKINTILNMAIKRSYVQAILTTTGADRVFTTEEEVERIKALNKKGNNGSSSDPGETIITFGYDKDKKLKDVDVQALQWVISKAKSKKLKADAEKVLKQRLDKETLLITEETGKKIKEHICSKTQSIKTKSRDIVGGFLKSKKLHVWDGLAKITENEGKQLLKKIAEELKKPAA